MRQPHVDMTTWGCHTGGVGAEGRAHKDLFDRLRQVRAEAIEHARKAQELAAERRELIRQLIADGFSQAEIARELGVTRQAIQKMLV
jgi:DNA invertase Pin-like site-specific DNA recombinase